MKWSSKFGNIIKYSEKRVQKFGFNKDTSTFLITTGLPEETAPFMGFSKENDKQYMLHYMKAIFTIPMILFFFLSNAQNFHLKYWGIGLGSNAIWYEDDGPIDCLDGLKIEIIDTIMTYSICESTKRFKIDSKFKDTILERKRNFYTISLRRSTIDSIVTFLDTLKGKYIYCSNPNIMSGGISNFFIEQNNWCSQLVIKNTIDSTASLIANLINTYLKEKYKIYLPNYGFSNNVYPDVLIYNCPKESKDSYIEILGQDYDVIRKSGQNQKGAYWDKIPKYTGWISDFEDIFTAEQERILDSLISQYEKRTSVEIAVVTIPKSATSEEGFDDLTLKIAKTWGVGKKHKDNGILIGISRGHRSMRIQNGFGIEKIMIDSITKVIVDQIFIPNFKKEYYFKGTFDGIVCIINFLDHCFNSTNVNLSKISVYQYIELLKINKEDSGNQYILPILNQVPEKWITENDIDSLMTIIHSTDPAKCILTLSLSNQYLPDSSTIGGHVMDILEAFKENKSYNPSQSKCPITDKKRIEMLELWWNEKKK